MTFIISKRSASYKNRLVFLQVYDTLQKKRIQLLEHHNYIDKITSIIIKPIQRICISETTIKKTTSGNI